MYDVRFRVELRCGAPESSAEGRGHTIRFSETGCEIVGEFPAVLDDSVELRVYVPDLDWPLRIDRARVLGSAARDAAGGVSRPGDVRD